jgi:hypothetical protein
MGVHPWPSLTVQSQASEHLCPSPTEPCFPGDSRRPQTMRRQPCSSHSGSWLRNSMHGGSLRSCPSHLWGWVHSMHSFPTNLGQLCTGDPKALDCDSCMCTTWAGSAVTKTLIFHTYYFCAGSIVESCTHNHTTYSVCFHDGQCICFNFIYCPREQWLEIQSFTSSGKLINCSQVNDPNKLVSIYFNVCAAIAKNTRPWGNCSGGF